LPPYAFAAQAPESLEARLFAADEVPWGELAFSSVALALQMYFDEVAAGAFCVHSGAVVKQPGAGPNEPGSFQLTEHIAVPSAWGPED
jgi:ADP-ribose/FAD diphosphatase